MRTASIAAIALLYATLISCESGRGSILVNPLIGTDVRTVEVEGQGTIQDKGQVMPAAGIPHGMTNWVAQTNATEKKCLPPYYYYQTMIQGFRASHWMNGSCTQDYGSVTIMPVQGTLKTERRKKGPRALTILRRLATPSSYSVRLKDYDIDVRMTGLSRSGIFSFHFNQDGDHFIVIEPNSDEGEAFIKIDPEKNEVYGYNPVHRIYQGYGKSAGFSGYFVIRFHDEFR
jgi:putative alpha-1,2-mannosidase